MLLHFTDALTNSSIAVNPAHVIAVFTAPANAESIAGKTIINIPSGTVAVTEDYLTVCGRMNGELK